jgi:hypothetical protein
LRQARLVHLDQRRRNILRRWSRFRWDSFGRPRLQVWTTSSLGFGLGLFALFPSIFLELYLRGEKLGSLPFSVFVSTSGGHGEGKARYETGCLAQAPALPRADDPCSSLGILLSLASYKAMEENPGLGRKEPEHSPLVLEISSRSLQAGLLRRFDHFLLASSQRLPMLALWVSLFRLYRSLRQSNGSAGMR